MCFKNYGKKAPAFVLRLLKYSVYIMCKLSILCVNGVVASKILRGNVLNSEKRLRS